MKQAVLEVSDLPSDSLSANVEMHQSHTDKALRMLSEDGVTSLAIVLPLATTDHDDWRHTLARQLARAHAPKRVNVIGVDDLQVQSEMLTYLRDAQGVTGQYLAAHE